MQGLIDARTVVAPKLANLRQTGQGSALAPNSVTT